VPPNGGCSKARRGKVKSVCHPINILGARASFLLARVLSTDFGIQNSNEFKNTVGTNFITGEKKLEFEK
jgi:hypothetical protein